MRIKYVNEAMNLIEMANITKRKSNLTCDVWSEHSGVLRNNTHSEPRVKLTKDNTGISVSIEQEPRILALPNGQSEDKLRRIFNDGIAFVGRNYDILLKHYLDTDDSFDDEDLFNALRERGEYK